MLGSHSPRCLRQSVPLRFATDTAYRQHCVNKEGARELKFAEPRLYADPEAAARKLVEIASTIEPVQERPHLSRLVNLEPTGSTTFLSACPYGTTVL
jgi:hypothetical protein